MRKAPMIGSLCLSVLFALRAFAAPPAAGPYAGLKITLYPGTKPASIEVRPDGTVVRGTTAFARLTADGLVDVHGDRVFKVAADGTVTARGIDKKLRFDAADQLLGENGAAMLSLPADGTPQMADPHGKMGPLPLKVEGANAKNRRMAELLILYLWLPAAAPGKVEGAPTTGDRP